MLRHKPGAPTQPCGHAGTRASFCLGQQVLESAWGRPSPSSSRKVGEHGVTGGMGQPGRRAPVGDRPLSRLLLHPAQSPGPRGPSCPDVALPGMAACGGRRDRSTTIKRPLAVGPGSRHVAVSACRGGDCAWWTPPSPPGASRPSPPEPRPSWVWGRTREDKDRPEVGPGLIGRPTSG